MSDCDNCGIPGLREELQAKFQKEVIAVVEKALRTPAQDIRFCRDFVIAATERLAIGNTTFDEHSAAIKLLKDWKAFHTGEHFGIEKNAKRTTVGISLLVSLCGLLITMITLYMKS